MRVLTTFLCGALLGCLIDVPLVLGQTQTRITPAISVTESYDTNVYFSSSGAHLRDYVTTTTPQLRAEHKGRWLDGTGQVSLIGATYVNNPGLNYIATNASLSAALDQLTGLVDKRWKLFVTDYVTYTPQPPAFYSPQAAGGTGSTATPNGTENFIRGVQAVRANSLINIANISSQYILTPITTLTGSFQHQLMRFGTSFAATPGQGFFTTTFENLNVGPRFQVTKQDSINLNGQYSHMTFSQGNRPSTHFDMEGATLGWTRSFSQKLSATATGGATVFSGSGNIQYLASGSVSWQERNTTFTASYSRSVFPSFFIAATPLLSQVVSASVIHRFTERLSAIGTANYGKNEAIGNTNLKFDSYGASASLNYAIAKTWSVSASYAHTIVKNSFNGQSFNFDRDVISVTLRKEWPDFFKPK